jgi:FKBP-type peptidyl-prolyl cis-trans isomerase
MKSKWMMILAVGMVTVQSNAQEMGSFTTEQEKLSYVIGVDMARNFKRQGIECDMDFVIKGLKDGTVGERLLISESDFKQSLLEVQNQARRKFALTRGQPPAERERKKGAMFLTENKAKEGVVALPSGLQYRIIKAGTGPLPTEADTVECNYRGTLTDGTEFDSSRPGQPASLEVAAVIPGWREALKLMPVGSKWQLFIPPELAYGVEGVGSTIGPNATLIFDVELLGVK